MAALRLGVACAVFDEAGQILLSKRGDFHIWNLPTGRLDHNETLENAAIREVREETGIEVEIVRAVGLYYSVGRDRMNILYEAKPIGGTLQQETSETRANQYFPPETIPDDIFGDFMLRDALTASTHIHKIETPDDELRQLKRKLAWRWIKNLFSGKPEPRYPLFNTHASLIIRNTEGHILTVPHANNQRILPGIAVNGKTAPWEQVQYHVRTQYDLYELRDATLSWRGFWQNPAQHALEFIFQTDIQPASDPVDDIVKWTAPLDAGWWGDYRHFAQHITAGTGGVLSIIAEQ